MTAIATIMWAYTLGAVSLWTVQTTIRRRHQQARQRAARHANQYWQSQ